MDARAQLFETPQAAVKALMELLGEATTPFSEVSVLDAVDEDFFSEIHAYSIPQIETVGVLNY